MSNKLLVLKAEPLRSIKILKKGFYVAFRNLDASFLPSVLTYIQKNIYWKDHEIRTIKKFIKIRNAIISKQDEILKLIERKKNSIIILNTEFSLVEVNDYFSNFDFIGLYINEKGLLEACVNGTYGVKILNKNNPEKIIMDRGIEFKENAFYLYDGYGLKEGPEENSGPFISYFPLGNLIFYVHRENNSNCIIKLGGFKLTPDNIFLFNLISQRGYHFYTKNNKIGLVFTDQFYPPLIEEIDPLENGPLKVKIEGEWCYLLSKSFRINKKGIDVPVKTLPIKYLKTYFSEKDLFELNLY